MIDTALENSLKAAVSAILPDADLSAVQVRPCPDPKFGDYQCSALMGLAKSRKLNPRKLAEDVLSKLDVASIAHPVEIAGAGFLNFRLKSVAVSQALSQGVFPAKPNQPRRLVIDFSSPNVAKPMHVGHIRSTVLGDCLARVNRFLGHEVITDNHIGDWGTQFGKLLIGWKKHLNAEALQSDPIAEMERLYKLVNAASEKDEAIANEARAELVKLQNRDQENLAIWKRMQELSQKQFDDIYGRLGVKFDHTLGESFYNPWLAEVVNELKTKGIATESEGATVVLFDNNPELKNTPAIVQKRDGGFNYASTDLATIRYRVQTWKPEVIVYVTDGRQQLHFKQLFAIWKLWHPESPVQLSHVWFGSILGEDGTPFKTRSGETVKLAELLDEAVERALAIVSEKNPELSDAEKKEIARVVGIGAVKYADLLQNRQTDYIFSWQKMLALNGNTAPYLQYAYTRVRSIFRKGDVDEAALAQVKLILEQPDELALAKHLLQFSFILRAVAEEYRPNYLCNYLFELAGHYARFYESCPVLKAEGAAKNSRLALCASTAQVLRQCLYLLGIETTEQM